MIRNFALLLACAAAAVMANSAIASTTSPAQSTTAPASMSAANNFGGTATGQANAQKSPVKLAQAVGQTSDCKDDGGKSTPCPGAGMPNEQVSGGGVGPAGIIGAILIVGGVVGLTTGGHHHHNGSGQPISAP